VGGEVEEEEDAETMTLDDEGRKRLLGQIDQMEDELKQSWQHLLDSIKKGRKGGGREGGRKTAR